MKPILLLGAVGVLVVGGFFVFSSSKPKAGPKTIDTPTPQIANDETKTVEIKASFAIFTNGTFRIFTATMYHNLSPDVYIESQNPNIVHVKTANITWDHFFKTLPMKLTRDCLTTGTGQTFCTKGNQTLKFYINGRLYANALDRTIDAGDQLLVSYGNENNEQIKKQLDQIPVINQK